MANGMDDAKAALEKQIAELRREVAGLRGALADKGAELLGDVREQAGHAYEDVSREARRLAGQLSGHALTATARENPGTTSAVLGVAALLGFILGVCVGQSTADDRRKRW